METIRDLFRMTGRSIDQDREIGSFGWDGTEDVSWLNRDPQTAEEVAENIYERMVASGFTISYRVNGEPDRFDLMTAYLARKGAQGEDTL